MKIEWVVTSEDIAKVAKFFRSREKSSFVVRRKQRNLSSKPPAVTLEQFWRSMVICLLTTQQRSGPDSHVNRFVSVNPFPLEYEACHAQEDLIGFVSGTIARFGGLRRGNTIAGELHKNAEYLRGAGWLAVGALLDRVRTERSKDAERAAARFIDNNFAGFGPKQSRNLLQILGLSQYEIPIDSRITKWLNDFGFPVELSAGPLSDQSYYEFVSDGFQHLAKACEISPCLLDAAIFSSFDGDGWERSTSPY